MRSVFVGLALLASTPALALDQGAEALLRGVSAQSAIRKLCTGQFEVDLDLSKRMGLVARATVASVIGESATDDALRNEMARRRDEIELTGQAQWCRYQHALYSEQRIPVFKN